MTLYSKEELYEVFKDIIISSDLDINMFESSVGIDYDILDTSNKNTLYLKSIFYNNYTNGFYYYSIIDILFYNKTNFKLLLYDDYLNLYDILEKSNVNYKFNSIREEYLFLCSINQLIVLKDNYTYIYKELTHNVIFNNYLQDNKYIILNISDKKIILLNTFLSKNEQIEILCKIYNINPKDIIDDTAKFNFIRTNTDGTDFCGNTIDFDLLYKDKNYLNTVFKNILKYNIYSFANMNDTYFSTAIINVVCNILQITPTLLKNITDDYNLPFNLDRYINFKNKLNPYELYGDITNSSFNNYCSVNFLPKDMNYTSDLNSMSIFIDNILVFKVYYYINFITKNVSYIIVKDDTVQLLDNSYLSDRLSALFKNILFYDKNNNKFIVSKDISSYSKYDSIYTNNLYKYIKGNNIKVILGVV